jgi:heavy metal sensor kinase
LEELRRFALSLAASGLGVWLLGLLGGWWLAGRAIKPIATISATATRIAEGNLEQRISTDGTESEFDQLSRVLNDTFDRLHSVLKQQKQFTADASHELRTPVTILLSETHRILKRERTPAEYQDVIRTCHAAAERMRRLVEGMLLLARQDNDAAGPRTPAEACDLAAIARSSLEQLRPLAAERGIEVHAALQPAECRGDASALSILVNNLVGNAIQHHGSPGNVWIECGSAEGGVFLEVRDDGPGIRAEDLPHIFERFYRADKARGAAAGHTGLGLAIVKRIAENHRGGVVARSEAGKGASFRVTLPR